MMDNFNISKKFQDDNDKILIKFNTFLLSDAFVSKKIELEKSDFSNELTTREFSDKYYRYKYIRRLINEPKERICLSDILNMNKMTNTRQKDVRDITILMSNYIEDIRNNNYIEENILYTNFNLENYTGEDISTNTILLDTYRKDLNNAKAYKLLKNKCNEKYFDIEFKILNLLGKSNSKKLLFGDHIKNIWKTNESTNELGGYIKYILKLIESIDYFSKVESNLHKEKHHILNKTLNRIIDLNHDIKTILGNNTLMFGIYKNHKNKLTNTTLEKYNEILIIFCSFLLILDRTEYSESVELNNEYIKYENKLHKNLQLHLKKLDIISLTNIYLHKNNIFDYKIYFVFLYLKNLINIKHYYRDENMHQLKTSIEKYIKNFTLYNHGVVNKMNKYDIVDYFSIVNLYKIYTKFLNKELFFECYKSDK